MNYKNFFFPLNPIEHNGYTWGQRLTFKSRIKIGLREIFFGKSFRYKFISIFYMLKHLYFKLYNLIFFPFIIICFFFKIKFIHISSWQIGSYIHQLDTIIKANKLGKNYKLVFLCPNFICSNKFISKLYSKQLICIKNIFAYVFLLPLMHSELISITAWPFETHNKKSKFNEVHSNYLKKFKREILKLEFNKLKKNFKKKDYNKTVCIHLRDNYYKDSNTNRNVKIDQLKKTINFLLKKKFKVLRFINYKSKNLDIKNKNYTEFLVSSESDKINQFLIINSCRLLIGSQSGILNYNLISKTPFLLTNAIPINNIMVIKKCDMYIFKKIKRINGKYLTLNDIIKYKFHLHPEKIKKSFKIIDNTENEILDSTKEVLKIKNFKTDKKILKSYSDILNKISSRCTNAKISKSFLNKNKRILI